MHPEAIALVDHAKRLAAHDKTLSRQIYNNETILQKVHHYEVNTQKFTTLQAAKRWIDRKAAFRQFHGACPFNAHLFLYTANVLIYRPPVADMRFYIGMALGIIRKNKLPLVVDKNDIDGFTIQFVSDGL